MDNKTKEEFIERVHQLIGATEDAISSVNNYICEVQGNLHHIEGLIYLSKKINRLLVRQTTHPTLFFR